MRDLRPPKVPETPRFWTVTEDALRTATRHRRRIPRLPRFVLRWSAAPLGTGAVGLLAVAFVVNAAAVQPSPTSSIPHWTAPPAAEAPAPVGSAATGTPSRSDEHQALIDGQFRIAELRPDRAPALPPPTTVPQ